MGIVQKREVVQVCAILKVSFYCTFADLVPSTCITGMDYRGV